MAELVGRILSDAIREAENKRHKVRVISVNDVDIIVHEDYHSNRYNVGGDIFDITPNDWYERALVNGVVTKYYSTS